ncbi:MAG: molybdenum cofactor biosynthesis protein MoaE [Bacteroidia bacterium]|nr:molybdenum cofactor biosynthesis protein MoaE [Bacteroidia bacterium]
MAKTTLIKGPVTHELISSRMRLLGENREIGGHSIFLGQVRADIKGIRKVKAIEYSAYEEMVNREAESIKQKILSEYNDVRSIDIFHSTGVVMAGEISLMVLVSAGHRQHAMAACDKTVEMIKEKLPVWKKEIFEDNSHEWKRENLA